MAQLLERSLPTQRFTVLIQKSAKFKWTIINCIDNNEKAARNNHFWKNSLLIIVLYRLSSYNFYQTNDKKLFKIV